jgi:5-methylcytosine-specific restriction endonuclease McrA
VENAVQNVLVLNRLWQAVNVCRWERAIALLYSEHAQVVHETEGSYCTFDFNEWCLCDPRSYANDCLHTVSLQFQIPHIILLRQFDRYPRKDVKFTRGNVFERDNFTCQYCGIQPERKLLNMDHVFPKSRGGKTVWDNVVCSCITCNSHKGDRTPEEARMYLRCPVVRPTWQPFTRQHKTAAARKSWHRFLA